MCFEMQGMVYSRIDTHTLTPWHFSSCPQNALKRGDKRGSGQYRFWRRLSFERLSLESMTLKETVEIVLLPALLSVFL